MKRRLASAGVFSPFESMALQEEEEEEEARDYGNAAHGFLERGPLRPPLSLPLPAGRGRPQFPIPPRNPRDRQPPPDVAWPGPYSVYSPNEYKFCASIILL